MTEPDRPTPLRTVAQDVSIVVGIIGTTISALLGFGIVTAQQGDALTGLLGLIPGLVTGISATAAAFGTARRGEAHVTPLSSPVNALGQQLLPVVGSADHGRHEMDA